MAIIGQVGGKELSSDMQKIYDKLVELLKGGKELNISIDELKKKAGVPNANNSTISSLIKRKQKQGIKFFNNINITFFAGGLEIGKSKHDITYSNNKKFRDFYNRTYDTPWEDLGTRENSYRKGNAWDAFLRNKKTFTKTDFTLTADEVAKKLGITQSSLRTYEAKPDNNTSSRFIADNIKKIRTIKDGKSVTKYKDPGVNVFKKWNALQASPMISKKMIDNIKEYDELFRDQIKNTKKLPDMAEVIQQTSMKTPATIANTEALYSRILRGEIFKQDANITNDAVLGKKIMEELSLNKGYNMRRSAFYRLALDNVNKMYPGQSGNLETFKTRFRNELKKTLGLKKGQAVPFSVNEVISLAAGESRGVQPFSVFVDAVETNINKGELSYYQSEFSKKLDKVQKLLSGNKPNIGEAEKIALSLDTNRKTLVDSLTNKGFTKTQINQLNLPDIKVGTDIDPKIYSPEKLARWKEQTKGALDIEKFAKDKGYYIDAKKAKPYFDVSQKSFRNVILQAAKTNEGGVCQIFRAEGGRIGYAAGSNCARQMEFAFDSDPVRTTEQINKIKTVPEKVKGAATGFLNFVKRGGKYGAIAAGGAAVAGLVKTFMNDDP